MTARLVRMPDQFRPARDAPIAATPTCCCCCCCCIATLITASVVLPMRVELMSHGPDGERIAPAQVRSSKFVAGTAPILSFVLGSLLGFGIKEVMPFFVGFPLILMLMLGLAFAPFGRGVTAIPTTIVFFLAFAAEFMVGGFGILATAGILYLAVAVVFSVLVINQYRAKLRHVRMAPTQNYFGTPAWEPRPSDPPPLPRPPSSEE